jgi:hypothetical protein
VAAALHDVVADQPLDIARLEAAGIRWVISHGEPAPLPGVTAEIAGPTIHLYQIPEPIPPVRPLAPPLPVALGHLVTWGTAAGSAAVWTVNKVKSRR